MSSDQELRQVAEDVIRPLMRGLSSFNRASEMLLSLEPGVILRPENRLYRDIRENIESAKQQMDESHDVAKAELQRTDVGIEILTVELNELGIEKGLRESELQDLIINLESHRDTLNTYNESLEFQKRNLMAVINTRDHIKRRREDAELKRNLGILAFPFGGWIAGAIILGISVREWNEANAQVDRATKEVNKSQTQVNRFSDKVSEYKSMINSVEYEITKANNRIDETELKLRSVHMKHEFVADVQQKIRRAVHQLGLLSGVGSVAELQTQHMIVLEPMTKVFGEMPAVLSRITGDDLLHTVGMHSLINDMKENQRKLKQLVDFNRSLDFREYF